MGDVVVSEERLAQMMGDVFTQKMSERRAEIVAHSCICSDLDAKAKHTADHEIIHRIGKFLDRVENAKWGFLMLILAVLVSSGAYALWEGIKATVKGK